MRTWIALMTSCSLLLVAPFLTGLGFGDSPLVILSCFLVLSFVISFLFVFSSLFVIFDMRYTVMHEVVF